MVVCQGFNFLRFVAEDVSHVFKFAGQILLAFCIFGQQVFVAGQILRITPEFVQNNCSFLTIYHFLLVYLDIYRSPSAYLSSKSFLLVKSPSFTTDLSRFHRLLDKFQGFRLDLSRIIAHF